jgi:DNA-binding transcriptional MerR regulator/effector-binding domain-containing protein
MSLLIPIGDFARATHMTVKTLRHYHENGLLEPAEIDTRTGYRRYTAGQIATAHIIRRFRELDMPLSEIRAVLTAPDLQARNELIVDHLNRLESHLARTQGVVASLRDLLQHPESVPWIQHRSIKATASAAISELLDVKDALSWYQGALAELHATLTAQRVPASGPAGGVFSNALFSDGRGEATIFIPCDTSFRSIGRVKPTLIPAIEVAIIMHSGALANVDLAYGALAKYVAQHELAVDGPIREYYVVSPHDTAEESKWRTEIAWPIFPTGARV